MIDSTETGNPLHTALRACRTHFIYAGLFSGLINILYLAPSIFMLQVYDRVVPTRGFATLLVLTLILAISLIVFALLDTVRMRLLLRASVRLERMAAPDILHRILGTNGASLMQRAEAMRNFDKLRGTLTGPAIIALFDAPWAPIYIVISYMLHPLIGLLALLSSMLLIGIAVASDIYTRKGLEKTGRQSSATYQIQEFSIQSAEVARALGMRQALVTRHLLERAELVRGQGEVAGASGIFFAITKFLRMLLQSLALALGAYLAINQQISAGAIFAASLILGRALQPVEQILGALKNVLEAQNAYRGLSAFCRLPSATDAKTQLPTPAGHIQVTGVTVRVPGVDRPILSNVSFEVRPGEIVAVVGPSGAGKSTLLRAMAGALEVDDGEIRVDGASLAEWDRELLGRNVGYMPQTPTLFPAAVHTNISRFRGYVEPHGEAMDAKVIAAARQAGAHELILRFSQGYETRLVPREGGGLSAGQRQVVALARALYDEPALLFLDEPNAHLDINGETRLLETLARLKERGATVIVSTHRTGLLQAVDKVLLLRDGMVQVYGDRDEVIRGAQSAPGGRVEGAAPPAADDSAATGTLPAGPSPAPPAAPSSHAPASDAADVPGPRGVEPTEGGDVQKDSL
ncbi:type I secretion system permease/ATPase [Sphingomonas solaris]|uniref:Type I secretion system permease/ATPase n=1 Tax=Alterirhizorhabdus solaris TaxID=2529389 RepID=A0A558QY17_9SPHN|nr:type I secretion system permease/ATPase [Sphingomonas solaris]TVV71972.1 type I secretion system permease/ATPase [Sphingomonas solaris]